MDEACAMANRLTEDQRHDFVNGACAARYPREGCICSVDFEVFIRLGLAVASLGQPSGVFRTPLGLQVQAVIEDSPHVR
jgi:hypothetical protein